MTLCSDLDNFETGLTDDNGDGIISFQEFHGTIARFQRKSSVASNDSCKTSAATRTTATNVGSALARAPATSPPRVRIHLQPRKSDASQPRALTESPSRVSARSHPRARSKSTSEPSGNDAIHAFDNNI